ncbi:export of O-antigen and teichoic acid [Candidatus Scalindua japonica]|uniref:Export of O-antigen and teichoic acid n=1 Tax=Candidatus Scalindua japonica TaxID=1284222 RepID=A0A286U454_9BACT|nr:oligosaccharide flippase family protein [Candidatus Scalindua japonica]GAX62919.1 export of O-antigen and teichoic acid [Candidatus Scalindua japonica]
MFKDILSLIKQTIAYGSGQMLIRSLGIILIPVYTRVLTVSDYGIINTLASFSAILMYFYNFGLSGAVMRYDAELHSDEERRIAHGTAWVFLVLMALGITVLLAFISPFTWKFVFPSVPIFPFAFLVIATVAIESTNVVPMALLRIRGKAITFSTIQFLQFLSVTSLIILFVVVLHLGAKGQFFALMLNSAIFAILYVVIALRQIKMNLNFHYLKKYLSFGLPLIPSGLSMWFLSLSSILIIQWLISLEAVGLFGLGFKFGLILDLFVVAILTAWQPFFYKKAETEEGIELFSLVGTYFLFVVMGIGVALSLAAYPVLHLVTTPDYFAAGSVVGFIIIGVVIRAMYYFNVQGIAFMKKTKYLPLIDGSAAALNIGLCLLLIPRYGIKGAAFSTMMAYFLQLSICFIVSKRLYPIPYQYGRLIKILIIFVLAYVGLSHVEFNSDLWTLTIRMGMLPLIVLVGLLLFRVLEEREIRKISQLLLQYKTQFAKYTTGKTKGI